MKRAAEDEADGAPDAKKIETESAKPLATNVEPSVSAGEEKTTEAKPEPSVGAGEEKTAETKLEPSVSAGEEKTAETQPEPSVSTGEEKTAETKPETKEEAKPAPATFNPFGGFTAFQPISSFTTDPSASPFQFPSPVSNGFGQLAQEAAKKTSADEEGKENGGDEWPPVELQAAAPNATPKFASVEVSTGEEEDRTLFSIKAKILQLMPMEGGTGMEWKERGRGLLKINQHKKTHKARLLLRTDVLHALALNINLDSSCTFVPPDEHANTLRFSCFSTSDSTTSYCIRYIDAASKSLCSYKALYDKLSLAKDEEKAPKLAELFGCSSS